MSKWLEGLSVPHSSCSPSRCCSAWSVVAAILGAVLVRLGMRRPATVERASRLAERALGVVKRPLTIVVLDEVAAVIQTGHYTKNISAALVENHDKLKALAAEKVGRTPTSGSWACPATRTRRPRPPRRPSGCSSHARRPRTASWSATCCATTSSRSGVAVRDRNHERVGPHAPPDPVPASAPRPT